MARRSLRVSAGSAGAGTPVKAESKEAGASAGAKRGRATPKKSQHFASATDSGSRRRSSGRKAAKAESSEDELSPTKPARNAAKFEAEDDEDDSSSDEDGEDDDASAFGEDGEEEDGADDSEDIEGSGSEEDFASDDDEIGDAPPSKKRKTTSGKAKKGKELWRTDVKVGLGPGKAVVIERPKARAAGKIAYEKHTIHPNTLLFLGDLAQNNDREWLKMHDPDYRKSWNDFTEWIECLQEKIIEEADETIPELPVKDVFFRIYRDVRFSSDPTPYKAHFSAAWSRTGRKGPFAAYYVQIKPGQSFVGGGLWMPEAQAVAKLRRDIDRKPHKIKAVLNNAEIRKHFMKGIAKDDRKAVKAFCAQNSGNALKTKPKGFESDHPNIELLRLKNFTMGASVPDEEVVGEGGLEKVTGLIKALVPFISYLNSIVMPDGPEADDSEQESEDEVEAEEAGE